MVRLLREKNPPMTVVILVSVLPRGDAKEGNIWPQPNKYTQSINDLNTQLAKYAEREEFVVFADCTQAMLLDGQVSLAPQLCCLLLAITMSASINNNMEDLLWASNLLETRFGFVHVCVPVPAT